MTARRKQKKDPAIVGAEVARRPGPIAVVWTLDTVKSRCRIDGDCWLWTGKVTDGRYPAAAINGITRSVARWVLEQRLGRNVAQGKHAALRCASGLCVSPLCVFEACRSETIKEALAGCRAKLARSAKTRERNRAHALSMGWAKLTAEKAADIRAQKGVKPVAEVAQRFGIAESTVYSIWQGVRWREQSAPAANGSSVFTWRPAA